MSSQREQTAEQKLFRQIGLWDMLNRFKRNSDSERAAVAKAHGIEASSLPGFGQEVPWGNNTIISQQTQGSLLGKVGSIAALTLAAGAIGFGANHLLNTPKTEVPPPVNAVLEWEITPDGEPGSRTIRESESRFSSDASGESIRIVD